MAASDTELLLYTEAYYQDPYPVLDRLRAEAPVYYSDREGAWVLTRHGDTTRVLRDHRTFSSVGRHARLLDPVPETDRVELAAVAAQLRGDMINVDPPAHGRMRALLAGSFTPRALERLRPRVDRIADELLDEIAACREIDVMRDLAYEFPARVVADFIGIPREAIAQFIVWADHWVDLLGSDPGERAVAAQRADASLTAAASFVDGLLRARLRDPRDDILTMLAHADGAALAPQEVLGNCLLLLLAGHETTSSVIGTAVLGYLQRPDERAAAVADPSLLRDAVEEFMRLESPVQRARRVATTDVEIGGRQVRAGQSVHMLLGAANRDPAEFGDPGRCDLRRRPNRHLAFGHGVHFCIGAPLARLEAPIALTGLLRRWPDLRPAGDGHAWLANRFVRRLERLPVVLA